jgi:hypothetical protein
MSDTDQDALVCSAKGCRTAAERAVVWRNPRLHDETRRKVWLACGEHTPTLRDYLAVRGFPVEVVGLHEIPEDGRGR